MTYNGHKNWNHWNVSLWINNDEGLHNLAKECVRESDTLEDAARKFMGYCDHWSGSKTPDGAPYSFSSVRAAMRKM